MIKIFTEGPEEARAAPRAHPSWPCPEGSALVVPQFQSHQIFHVLVVAAAFVHFYGVSNLQEFRYGLEGGCTDDSLL